MINRLRYGAIGLLLFSLATQPALACTGTKIEAQDGTVLFGRTLEFGVEMQSDVLVIPRNYQLTANSAYEGKSLTWKTKYAVLGVNAQSLPVIVEGVNEKSLRVGLFYFPQYAGYQKVTEEDAQNSISSYDVGTWILTNFTTIDEVKEAIKKIKVSDAQFKAWNFTIPLHYIVSEPSGNSLIIEYVDGTLNLYDDKMGVLANSPDFKWHQVNLKNFVNISATDVVNADIPSLNVTSMGLGSGMLGLLGDYTSPSRFVRMSVFTATSLPAADGAQALGTIFHLLNLFDVPMGSSIEKYKDSVFYDHTQWTTAVDLKKQILYFTTFANRNIKTVDLSKFDLDAKEIKIISMGGSTTMEDVSQTSKTYTLPQS